MSVTRGEGAQPTAEITLANAILDVLDQPSLLVRDNGVILAANQRWRTLFTQQCESPTLPTISQWLSGIEGGDKLIHALESMQSVDEPFELHIANNPQLGEARYAARLTRLAAQDRDLQEAIILLAEIDDHSSEDETEQIISDQINYLLVRQTLIEERERRRLGREVHDNVTQLLVGIRRHLADVRDNQEPFQQAETIEDVDRVIRVLQEITSSFSPPVLEDLGLLPAIHWLTEQLESNAGVTVRWENDGVEPRLSSETRTVVFRALRELTNNSIKHAPDAAITIASSVDEEHFLLEVHDDGPGFDRDEVHNRPHPYKGYGLLSIEQQIRAVGGKLHIRSKPGDGTHATISLPLETIEQSEGDTHAA